MKFIAWLFNISARHTIAGRKYENGGVGRRVYALIIMLVLAGLTAGAELWFTTLVNSGDNFLLIVFIGIMGLAFASGTMEYCAFYALTAFKMAIRGTVEKVKKHNAENPDNQRYIDDRPTANGDFRYRKLDYAVGVIALLLALAAFASVIILISFALTASGN